MVETVSFTHKAFFGFCPILMSDIDDIAPIIEPRWSFLNPLLILNEVIADVMIRVQSKRDPSYEPKFPVWGVKQMRKPIYRDFDIHE